MQAAQQPNAYKKFAEIRKSRILAKYQFLLRPRFEHIGRVSLNRKNLGQDLLVITITKQISTQTMVVKISPASKRRALYDNT